MSTLQYYYFCCVVPIGKDLEGVELVLYLIWLKIKLADQIKLEIEKLKIKNKNGKTTPYTISFVMIHITIQRNALLNEIRLMLNEPHRH